MGVLREALNGEAAAVRVRAAVALLDAAQRARDDEVSERLDALERRVEEGTRWPAAVA